MIHFLVRLAPDVLGGVIVPVLAGGHDSGGVKQIMGSPGAGTVHRKNVSVRRREAPRRVQPAVADEAMDDGEAEPLGDLRFGVEPAAARRSGPARGASAADYGTAHHRFLQFLALDGALDEAGLKQEADRMKRESLLRPDEAAALDFRALAGFWQNILLPAITTAYNYFNDNILPVLQRLYDFIQDSIGPKIELYDDFIVDMDAVLMAKARIAISSVKVWVCSIAARMVFQTVS